MPVCSIDFETRSTVDLRRSGVYPYAEHPDTDIICMAWAIGDEEPQVWSPRPEDTPESRPLRLMEHIQQGGEMRAHNAQFERIIWRDILGPRYGFPVPALEQWHCTAAEAAAMSLPRHLKGLSRVLKVEHEKDDAGHRLMLQMCRPRGVNPDGTLRWWDEEDPEKLARLIEYCRQDVRAERDCANRLRRLDATERQVYLLDQRINDRGILLDIPLIEAATKVVAAETEKANAELAEITDGAVTAVTQVSQLKDFCGLPNVRKDTVRDVLEQGRPHCTSCNGEGSYVVTTAGGGQVTQRQEDCSCGGPLSDAQIRALELRQETGKSSTGKLRSMIECRCADDRARGLVLYHGANTGRWSGKLIQPQNFPRPEVDRPERAIPLILAGEGDRLASPVPIVSSLLRSMLIASPGHRLLAGDFSQIEARVLGWLAGEPYGDKEYERMAAAIYGLPLSEIGKDSVERQVGKTTILGAGFQMGAARFQEQVATQTGIQLDDETAVKAIDTYRTTKAGIKQYWFDIEDAAMQAVAEPGKVVHVGPLANVRYVVRGQFLWCILPSGRPLAYALPSLRERTIKWTDIKGEQHAARKLGISYMGISSVTRKWSSQHLYGGLLTENVVQATARDLMALAMLRLEAKHYRPVLTVHDEVVSDTPTPRGSLKEYLDIMRQTPAWANGLTVEAEGWEGQRYRK